MAGLSWKLRPPQPPWFAVHRPQLLARLDAAFTTPVTLVTAPPGYGKSVLLGQWGAARAHRRIAWLNVEVADNDPGRFARHLAAALDAVRPGSGAVVLGALEPRRRRLGERFVDAVLRTVEPVDDAVLVVEDLDRLTNAALLADVGLLFSHLPAGLHVVLTTRGDPALYLHRRRVRDELVELRADDLRFTPEEASQLVRRLADVELGLPQRKRLMTRTDGWPLGVQQVALAIRDGADPGDLVEALAVDDRHLADYLTDEVLAHQSDQVRRFLVESSTLERLSSSLCDAALGRSDSAQLLAWLQRRALFITRTDGPAGWFRYASLFRDLLRTELRTTAPQRERAILRAAATWHRQQHQLAACGRYLVRAEAWEDLVAFVLRHGMAMSDRGEVATVLAWLAVVPAPLAASHSVLLAQAYLQAFAGEPLRADEQLMRVATDPEAPAGVVAVAHAFRSTLVQGCLPPQEAIRSADAALMALGDDSVELPDVFGVTNRALLRTVCALARARAQLYAGDLVDAETALRSALKGVGAAHPELRIQLEASLAMAQAWSGALVAASHSARRALDRTPVGEAPFDQAPASHVHRTGAAQRLAVADACVALAQVTREQGDAEAARTWLDEAEWRARTGPRHVLRAAIVTERAALCASEGRARDGLELLDRHASAGAPPPPAQLAARMAAVRARLLWRTGQAARARRSVEGLDTAPEIMLVRAELAAAEGDWPVVRKTAEAWPDDGTVRSELGRDQWAAAAAYADGSRVAATRQMARVLARAEGEGQRRQLLDGGPAVLRVVRAVYHADPSAFARSLLDAPRTAPPAGVDDLVEPLSERELAVLSYLPSRLSNAEIADRLFVSLNTLKTHLKHIYRKLGVNARDAAITTAEDLGLL